MLIIERVEDATPQLPAHERQRRARGYGRCSGAAPGDGV
jgi:hypothetical protein